MRESRQARRALQAFLNNFGNAARHMHKLASQTVGTRVHERKFDACRVELARTDRADSKVAATNSKERRPQKMHPDKKRPAKLTRAAEVQHAYARSTLEACVTQKKNPVELVQKSPEAVANTTSQVDATIEVSVMGLTARSGSSITSCSTDCTCNEPWNPFSSDVKDIDQGTKCNDSMLLKRQISNPTADTTVNFGISQQVLDILSTSQFVKSKSPEEECTKNPFDSDCAEAVSTSSPPFQPVSKNYGAEEWANNPLTEDFAQAADVEREEHIPNESAVRPIGRLTLRPSLSTRTKMHPPSRELPASTSVTF